jgi:tetratricopeptide (TPR) repeat protein
MMNAIFFAFTLTLLFSCNTDPLKKGDEAFSNESYLDAKNYYIDALQKDPTNVKIREKVIYSHFQLGEEYYDKRNLLRAFEGQVKEAFGYFPDFPSDSINKETSRVLSKLAIACRNYPPQNQIEKRNLEEKTVLYLKKASEFDSTNAIIMAEFKAFKGEKVSELMNKANQYFKATNKDPQYYFLAEYYFQKVLNIDPENQIAKANLQMSREKSMNIFNLEQYAPIAINKKTEVENLLAFEVEVLNNTNRTMELKGDGFYLLRRDSSKIKGIFSEDFLMPYVTKKLRQGEKIKGVVTFDTPVNGRYLQLAYEGGEKLKGYKNFSK